MWFEPSAVDPDTLPDLSWLGPAIGGAALVLVAGVNAVAAVLRRNQDRRDQLVDKAADREPTDAEKWDEVTKARREASSYYNLMIWFRDAFYDLAAALRMLARMIHERHPDMELPKEVVAALELRPPEDGTK